MSDPDCYDLLYGGERASRALRLDTSAPDCACSLTPFGPHGPVGSDEQLGRFVQAPDHTHKKHHHVDARVLTNAERQGMSVVREALASDEEVRRLADGVFPLAQREANPKFGLSGVILFTAGIARDLMPDEGQSVFCLYGTANKVADAHADVFQRVAGIDDARKTTRRIWLFEKIKGGFVTVEDYRNGLLIDLKPKVP